MYVELNHFAVQQKLTQHCKSTIIQLKKKRKKKKCNAEQGDESRNIDRQIDRV